jgi:hypothetical protein
MMNKKKKQKRLAQHVPLIANFLCGNHDSLVAAITTKKGYIAAEVIEGLLNTANFYDFVQEQVIHDCIYTYGVIT